MTARISFLCVDGRGSPLDEQEDLNRVSESALAVAKRQMDIAFRQNLCRFGDPGYVHDVRANFSEASEDCEWDDPSSSLAGGGSQSSVV